MILDLLKDSLLDSVKMLPFLFLAYLVIEYLEHRQSDRVERLLAKGGKYGFVPGALLGIVPQCGFSAIAANFYSSRVITLGTLMAVFLSTSDEAIPVMLAQPESYGKMFWLLVVKLGYALLVGFLLDVVLSRWLPDSLRGGYAGQAGQVTCHDQDDEQGVFISAVKHTLNIFLTLLAFTFVFGLLVQMLGKQRISDFLSGLGLLQPVVAGLFGLIPNCASSVLLTQLYLNNSIGFGSVLAGLSVNAGVGLTVLFKTNRNLRQNMLILGLLYFSGTLLGFLVHLFWN